MRYYPCPLPVYLNLIGLKTLTKSRIHLHDQLQKQNDLDKLVTTVLSQTSTHRQSDAFYFCALCSHRGGKPFAMACSPYKPGLGDTEFFQERLFVRLNGSSSKSSEVTRYFGRCSFHTLAFPQVFGLIIFFLSRRAENYTHF